MAKLTRKQLDEEIKVRFLKDVTEHLTNVGEEVLRVGSNEIALPVVDSEGEERWLVLTFKVPTGSRDGEEYDGYSMKEAYEMKLAEKAAKAEEAARKKAEKIKKDAASRAAKAAAREKAKAEREEREKET